MASSADKRPPSTPAQPELDGAVTGGNNSGPLTSASFRTGDLQEPATAKSSRPLLPSPSHSTTNSVGGSPKPSRETSPVRPQNRSLASTGARPNRSRKNSQELSPNRTSSSSGAIFPSIPSAAAVQRALSASKKTTLQPLSVFDGSGDVNHPEKIASGRGGESTPHWPGSPRLKSPPPSMSTSRGSTSSPRRSQEEHAPSNTSVKRLAPSSVPDGSKVEIKHDSESDDTTPRSVSRPSGRGASGGSTVLETVEESSLPATPSIGPGPKRPSYIAKQDTEGRPERIEENPMEESISSLSKTTGGSGSESGGNKSNESKAADQSRVKALTPSVSGRPPTVTSKRSHTALHPPKAKSTSDGPVRSMTVETETVSSVPQVSLAGGAGERGTSSRMDGGSVRLKPSNETIRPKKEKKRASRKPTSITSGAASSKADIFEAKVASAVDEANSSDSDETFVYESNPPEPHSAKASRHYSRTPSTTSMASQLDQYGSRYKQVLKDGPHSVHGKRSMKFTNSNYINTIDGDHSNSGSGRGSTKYGSATAKHHHIGRYGRGGGHASIIDGDSPFRQPNKSASPRAANGNSPRIARPNSPRLVNFRSPGSPRKGEGYLYDIETEGADDERTPLIGSVRINRNRQTRQPNSGSLRQVEYMEQRQRGFFSRYAACVIVLLLLLVLIIGAAAFIVALTKPLYEVSLKHLENVLASEQEIMLDLDIRATNPNLFAITVADMDVNIFAKSGYVGTSEQWRQHEPHATPIPAPPTALTNSEGLTVRWPWSGWPNDKGVDEGNDPIEDPEGDPQTMLLGRIFEFDSPLTFEPSPVKRRSTSSVGQVRMAKPGNETEEGGTARWERVLQHPFELIVRGVIKYQLPLSSKSHSASIGSRIKVLPAEDDDDDSPGHGKNKSRKALSFNA